MNPNLILEDIYNPQLAKDSAKEAQDEADRQSKRLAIWQAWQTGGITQSFIVELDKSARALLDDCFKRVLAGSITDVQLRAKITEAAVLNQVIAATANGQYERLNVEDTTN